MRLTILGEHTLTQGSFEDFVYTYISSYRKVFVEDLRVTTQ